MALDLHRGIRRLVTVVSLGCGAFGLWQAGLVVRDARAYQTQMREAAALWVPFDALYTGGVPLKEAIRARAVRAIASEPSLGRVYMDQAHVAEDRMWRELWEEGWTHHPALRESDSEKFFRYVFYRTTADLDESFPQRDRILEKDVDRLARSAPSLFAGVRDDVRAAAGHATNVEIWTAYIWILGAEGHEKLPWQFTWWPSQPAWWRWRRRAFADTRDMLEVTSYVHHLRHDYRLLLAIRYQAVGF